MRGFTAFKNLSIRYKLLASYVLVIMIPFLLLLFINVYTIREDNQKNGVYMAHKMLDETNSYLRYKCQAIMEALNFVALNNLVKENVQADPAPYQDINLWHMDALQLSALVNQFRYNEDIAAMQLYMKRGLAGATENPDFVNMEKVEEEQWFKQFAASRPVFTWLASSTLDGGGDSREVSVLRKIPNSRNIQQFDGMVRARVKQSGIQSVLDHAVLTRNTFSMLFNEQGELLVSSSQFPLAAGEAVQIVTAFRDVETTNHWNDNYQVNGQRYLLGIQDIPKTNMTVAMFVPYSDILASSNKAQTRTIMIFLLIIPLMLPLSYLVTSQATKRILQLLSQIRMMKNGRFPSADLPVSGDEIGELTRNFNQMAGNISHLMDETFLLGREVKNKELQALQAQINPHFLYNTLDLINVMAIESGAAGISKVVEELSVFYKLSLSNGKEYVTLGSELKHIEAYAGIQNMRFGNGIRLQIEVPQRLQGCIIPKILLQPVVENAVLHGIREKEDEEGTISVSAWTDAGDLRIEIADDGVGMTAEQLASLFTEQHFTTKGGGYGVRNIKERLQIAYGSKYGLSFDSSPGRGTRVTLSLPFQEESVEIQR
ncbi:sensor histidine kinase [Paenibacillus sp. MMS20-IR301]|uniref:cache domain-containing sensor histidine kinase n=1 Tax=Paenibacillus sp. MMS20-IR301 TaxID=2895946 RepID=UPI0028E4D911|nr:sensor histidine kinase [Paenibacillus sp. MMS20-IR301]WNS40720.1 sensor histidine kinase [Paenibacillus sp. MMS20-IR301]